MSIVTAFTQPPEKSQAEGNVQADDNVAIIDVDADAAVPTDLWSAAYREAVSSFGEQVNSVLLKGERIEQSLKSWKRPMKNWQVIPRSEEECRDCKHR